MIFLHLFFLLKFVPLSLNIFKMLKNYPFNVSLILPRHSIAESFFHIKVSSVEPVFTFFFGFSTNTRCRHSARCKRLATGGPKALPFSILRQRSPGFRLSDHSEVAAAQTFLSCVLQSIQNLAPDSSLLTPHRITRSARARTFGGIVRPICLAAFKLITSSNFFGCSTGNSDGVAPFRILST